MRSVGGVLADRMTSVALFSTAYMRTLSSSIGVGNAAGRPRAPALASSWEGMTKPMGFVDSAVEAEVLQYPGRATATDAGAIMGEGAPCDSQGQHCYAIRFPSHPGQYC